MTPKPTKKRRPPHGAAGALAPEKLRAARDLMGLTQTELGEDLGITKLEVYRKEKGLRPIQRVQVLAVRWLLHLKGLSDRQIAKITGKD